MSQKAAKRARKLERAERGISKEAERAEREFAELVARRRYELAQEWAAPVVSRRPRRQGLAWIGLAIIAALLLAVALGAR